MGQNQAILSKYKTTPLVSASPPLNRPARKATQAG